MTPYPVQLEATPPARFERIQLLLRLALAITLGWFGITAGWLSCVLFVALPIIVAIAISTRGSTTYIETSGPKLWSALRWLLAFSAYMLLVVDRFPVEDQTGVSIELQPTAHPTVGSALSRLVTSIPSAFVLILIGIVSTLLLLIGALAVLMTGKMPAGILAFQTGFVRWQARLLAYHASLVDEYPPFSFGADHLDATLPRAQGVHRST